MIDSGASGNFISTSTVNRFGLATQSKEHGYELVAVDGSALPGVLEETVPLQLVTQRHHEDIILDVVEMANHHIVLGMPWLRQHNPTIDWKSRMLRFQECDCVVDSRPAHRQRSVADERKGQTKARTACVAATSTKASSKRHDTGSAGTDLGGKEAIEHSILQTNKDGTLSARTHEFNAVLRIMKDDEEEFPISHDKYQVPEKHQEQCIRDHHDDPIHGHPGITKTIEIIRRNFAFPQMKARVTAYVQKCRSWVSPFYANFGKHPNLFMEPRLQHPNADKAMITSDALKKLHKQLRQKILSSQDGLRNSRQKSKPDPQLKEGDKKSEDQSTTNSNSLTMRESTRYSIYHSLNQQTQKHRCRRHSISRQKKTTNSKSNKYWNNEVSDTL
nr:retrotransposon-like protein 1 [Quercus suber]